ncbi:MAG: response regulator transcription factor [Bacteroidota bacterium]
MNQNPIKVILIDDHELFRFGINKILQNEDQFHLSAEYNSIDELTGNGIPGFDLALLDISLSEGDSFDYISTFRKTYPKAKLIILSSHTEEFYISRAIEMKVDGYIHKDTKPDELLMALKKINIGQKYFSQNISEVMFNQLYSSNSKAENFQLSNREKEIIKLLSDGLSSKEIADQLFLSHRTVETHRANVLKKLGLKNSSELIKYAVKSGLV